MTKHIIFTAKNKFFKTFLNLKIHHKFSNMKSKAEIIDLFS